MMFRADKVKLLSYKKEVPVEGPAEYLAFLVPNTFTWNTDKGLKVFALGSKVELKQLEYQKKTDEKLEQIFGYISDHRRDQPSFHH